MLLGDGTGKLGKPGPATKVLTALVGNGPDGTGFGLADVTGDGLSDILIQDPQGTETAPILHLYASAEASFMPSKELSVMGFEFADVDGDGKTDIVSTVQHRLTAQLSRLGGTFEAHDMRVDMSAPLVKGYAVDPGDGSSSPVLHLFYGIASCPTCGAGCSGRCLFNLTCVACVSDTDCPTGRCAGQVCVR